LPLQSVHVLTVVVVPAVMPLELTGTKAVVAFWVGEEVTHQ